MEQPRPPDWQIALVERAKYLRGNYITAYAQCEYILADLSVCFDLKFRYQMNRRISAARTLAAPIGPLSDYRDFLLPILENFDSWSEWRDWLAHGFFSLTTDKLGNHFFELRRYEQGRQNRLAHKTWRMDLPELEKISLSATATSHDLVVLHSRICSDLQIVRPEDFSPSEDGSPRR